MMSESPGNQDNSQLVTHLKDLEQRISRIETYLRLGSMEEWNRQRQAATSAAVPEESRDSLELRIGEYWFAKTGIVLLALGIVFLLTLPFESLPPVLPSVIGYLIVGLLFLFSHVCRKSFDLISRYLLGGALLLLYFATLRLHFFGARAAVESSVLESSLLLFVVFFNLYIGLKRGSVYLTALNLVLISVTAIIGRNPHFIFLLMTLLSFVTISCRLKLGWHNLAPVGIFLVYFTHFIWAINNPMVGNKIQFITEPAVNLLFLLAYTLVFASGTLFREKKSPETGSIVLSTFLNTAGFAALYLMVTMAAFRENAVPYHLAASVMFLILSIAFWIRHRSKYSTFFYAMTAYGTLSVAIIHRFGAPEFFVALSWQSILVITTAIWFRSKIIIVTNFFLYLVILIAFLTMAGKVSLVSLSFGIVALMSARVLNWKKDRLELQTEQMRNAYLTCAFFIFPYTLYHAVPRGYLIFSWVIVTVLYYLLSAVLKNKKYLWMGHLTLLLTVGYVIIVGTVELEPVYRIISFLVVGMALLIVSLVYTKLKSKVMSAGESELDLSK